MNTNNPQGNPALNISQQRALQAILEMEPGQSLFLTGDAGTGKSFLVRHLTETLPCIVTASTGLAAVNVGGVTAHSFFGLHMGIYNPQTPPKMGKTQAEILEATEYVIVDEASMLRSDTVDAIDHSCQIALKNNKRFGGKKFIFVGDVFQLPPIVTSSEKELFYMHYGTEWFFDAFAFNGNIKTVVLDEPMRQSDPDMIDALNAVRYGDCSGLDYFNQQAYKSAHPDAVTIVGKNDEARNINISEFQKLRGDQAEFYARVTGDYRESEYPVEEVVRLKVGAKVIICKNFKDEYKNGEIGKVLGFMDGAVEVEISDGRIVWVEPQKWEKAEYVINATGGIDRIVVGEFKQVPLKLGYAITVHKSQGQTYNRVNIDLPYTFSPGQLYVALSRCKTLEGMTLKQRLKPSSLKTCPRVLEFMGGVN